tara:strand:+ start:71 stop:1573 length:1503 start_codon:yes stop_codon:yes gene_type:complete
MAIDARKEGEHGSLVTMYYAIAKGKTLGEAPEGPKGKPRNQLGKWDSWMTKEIPYGYSAELQEALNTHVLSGGDTCENNPVWVNCWANQTLAISPYIDANIEVGTTNRQGSNAWKYGWFEHGKDIPGVDPSDRTDCLEIVWQTFFGNADIKKHFNSKKDNWNPTDTYLVNATEEPNIAAWCKKLMEDFEKDNIPWEKFVLTVNAYLSNLVQKKLLIPISLKLQTPSVSMSYKENNVFPFKGKGGKIDIVDADFIETPYSYYEVVDNKGTQIDFKGNSFVYKAKVTAGVFKEGYEYQNDTQYYKIEQRMQKQSVKQECKDIRLNDSGDYRDAKAQAGNVPVEIFKDLITEFAGADIGTYDKFIPPIGTALSDINVMWWAKEYNKVKASFRKIGVGIDLGDTTIFGTKYTAYEYFRWLSRLDVAEDEAFNSLLVRLGTKKKLTKGVFSAKFRNKLFNIRFMKAITNARKDGKLGRFLATIYYKAAKQKMTNADFEGPFVKLH